MAMPTEAANQDISPTLQRALEVASARHKHLCPRQVLGARVAIAGAGMLELDVPRADKRLLVIVETDGCFVDGVEAVAGVAVGRRTLRVEDYGKIAATFVDVKTGRALRVAPQVDVRARARHYAPEQSGATSPCCTATSACRMPSCFRSSGWSWRNRSPRL